MNKQDPRLQGRAPGFWGGEELTGKGQDRDKTRARKGQVRDKTGTRQE